VGGNLKIAEMKIFQSLDLKFVEVGLQAIWIICDIFLHLTNYFSTKLIFLDIYFLNDLHGVVNLEAWFIFKWEFFLLPKPRKLEFETIVKLGYNEQPGTDQISSL